MQVRRPEALQSSEPDEISVVCYNLLADVYATPKRYPYVRPEWLAWPHRWAALQQQLASFGADVICLQEVEPARWGVGEACVGGDVVCSSPNWGFGCFGCVKCV